MTMLSHNHLTKKKSPYNVITSSPTWSLSGVNTFSANLVRGLQEAGIQAHILLTDKDLYERELMPLPADIRVERFPIGRLAGWRARWQGLIRYLEDQAPCIYLPNYDFRCSCISPKLSTRVGIVGIVHNDDRKHYDHVTRLGRYWNAIVAVGQTIAENTAMIDPTFLSRLVTIPYGVEVPSRLPERRVNSGMPLKIVYTGRLVQYQKRILDLPLIAHALAARAVPFELTILGSGEEKSRLKTACQPLVTQGIVRLLGTLPNEQTLEALQQSDVLIMTSEFEGLSLSLLEAMGQGCVPVVTDIRSGVPELIQDGINGFQIPIGDIQSFVSRLELLQRDVVLRRSLAAQAYYTVHTGGYRISDMVEKYTTLFEHILQEARRGDYIRPTGEIVPPPSLTWRDYLPYPVQAIAYHIKQLKH